MLSAAHMYDPRIIANYIIRHASESERPVTNLALQKLLYLAHAQFYIRFKKPLVKGYFEAWQFGPVMPSIYRELKKFGRDPIQEEFLDVDLFTGEVRSLPFIDEEDVVSHLEDVTHYFKKYSAGQLVDVTHAEGGPWHYVWHKSRTDPFADRRISDNVTLSRFANLKRVIEAKR